jgi:hypothetical protein
MNSNIIIKNDNTQIRGGYTHYLRLRHNDLAVLLLSLLLLFRLFPQGLAVDCDVFCELLLDLTPVPVLVDDVMQSSFVGVVRHGFFSAGRHRDGR